MTEQKQRRKPRKYTDEFKQQLVDLYHAGKRRCDICREYDILTYDDVGEEYEYEEDGCKYYGCNRYRTFSVND